MYMKFSNLKILNKGITLFCLFFLSLLPFGNGGLEGDQRNLPSWDRHDNWNAIVPIVYGQWPNFFGSWRISLTIFQLLLYWLGIYLIFKNYKFNRITAFFFFVLFYLSTFFTANLFRDASLFALSILGVGFLFEANRRKKVGKKIYFITGILCLLLASMFKPFYSLILNIIILNSFLIIFSFKLKEIFKVIPIFVLVFIFSFNLNSVVATSINLKEVYPQQQPVIMDLSAQYCWGTDPEQISLAGNALKGLVKEGYPLRSLCSSLRPDSWDNLHSYPEEWQYANPIQRITHEGNKNESDKLVSELINNWTSLIITHPVDWLQVRLYFLGPTLFASNSFTANIVSKTSDSNQFTYLSKMWNLLLLPVLILDKFRITSIGFGFILLALLYTNYRSIAFKSGNHNLKIKNTLLISFVTLTITLTFGTLVSVANNGRYFLPYILLTYFLVLRSGRIGL